MSFHVLRCATALVAAATLAACAGGGTSEPPIRIGVTTTPAGANCEARRDGQPIGRVAPTPGILRVTNSARPITLACEAPDHAGGVSIVPAVTDGATVGLYFLAGGLVGLAAASASGAAYTYPGDVAVTLIPQAFPDTTQRDAFFDALVARLRQQIAGSNDTATNTLFEAEIARLEGLRQSVRVGA